MIRGAQVIRELTGWNDSVDITTIKAYLVGDHGVDISTEASVEVKRGRAAEDEEAEEPASKKKPPNGRRAISIEGPANHTRQIPEGRNRAFYFSPKKCTTPKRQVGGEDEQREGKEKGRCY
jgi:hypothetical protein